MRIWKLRSLAVTARGFHGGLMGMQDELKKVIEAVHGVPATFLEQVAVTEKLEGRIVFQGAVYVFQLSDSPFSDKCYAWYSQSPEKGGRRIYSVLHKPPIDSPGKAVRSSIDRSFKS